MSGRDPAASRFAMLQAVRLSGAVLALMGVLVMSGNVGWLQAVPKMAGYPLLLAGMAEFFFVPPLLARRWKSRD
ncbi:MULTISPECIES: hypothetical protein [Novosphingobium]|uniref:hypothetical protein n=1 Tax=Novosphingobium TaxID=165696 RepID=UPI001CD462CE|nr:hypothetical protein [Novosphingobium percolationis]MCH7627816.1 hypothetical protein [Pseudomonadota bacterium]